MAKKELLAKERIERLELEVPSLKERVADLESTRGRGTLGIEGLGDAPLGAGAATGLVPLLGVPRFGPVVLDRETVEAPCPDAKRTLKADANIVYVLSVRAAANTECEVEVKIGDFKLTLKKGESVFRLITGSALIVLSCKGRKKTQTCRYTYQLSAR